MARRRQLLNVHVYDSSSNVAVASGAAAAAAVL